MSSGKSRAPFFDSFVTVLLRLSTMGGLAVFVWLNIALWFTNGAGHALEDANTILRLSRNSVAQVGPYTLRTDPFGDLYPVSKTTVSVNGVPVLVFDALIAAALSNDARWTAEGPWVKDLPPMLAARRAELERIEAEMDAAALERARQDVQAAREAVAVPERDGR